MIKELSAAAMVGTTIAGYFTHLYVTISVLTAAGATDIGYGLLLALGVLCPPIGAIHGIGYWFGVW